MFCGFFVHGDSGAIGSETGAAEEAVEVTVIDHAELPTEKRANPD